MSRPLTCIALDVTEPRADPMGQTTGGQLIVDANHSYSDLDELIVNHVQAMARRVEELMAHEKFKQGSEEDLREFGNNLSNLVAYLCSRSVLEEFRRSQSCEERVWLHSQSKKAWSFQRLLPG